MADGFSIRVLTADVLKDFDRIDRDSRRATMWTVRAAGRLAKQTARRQAPVYRGPPRKTYGGKAYGGSAPLVPGELKKAIHSSKRLRPFGKDGFAVGVAPRTPRTHLYSAAQERRHGFMAAGRSAAESAAPRLAEQAYARVTRRR